MLHVSVARLSSSYRLVVFQSPDLALPQRALPATRVATPPTWQRSQNPPWLKKSKKSLRKSLWESLRGSWPTAQNESKTSLLESLRVKNHLFFDSRRLVFDSFWGVGRDPWRLPQRLSRRFFFDFLSRRGFWLLCQVGGVAIGGVAILERSGGFHSSGA